jgi:predicted metalloprotease
MTRVKAAQRFLVAALVSLCAAATPTLGGTALADAARPDPVHTARAAAPRPAPTAMNDDERAAIGAVGLFWRRHFQPIFDRPYSPPRVIGGYVGDNGPDCAGHKAEPFNAFYCKPGDYLAWDQNLMAAGYQQIGDSWVYLIIAHEWGHAIQARLSHSLVSQADELQADCLAGATLEGAQRDGLLRMDPGDDAEIARALTVVADKYPWSNKRDHGDAQQRIDAYNRGDRGGVPACF